MTVAQYECVHGAWLAQMEERATLDPRVLGLKTMLGIFKITETNKT